MRSKDSFKTQRARALRQQDNEAETQMWYALKARRLNGFKFVRQQPIGNYFADCACRGKKLVIEIDGSQHVDSSYDAKRDEFMNRNGWSVLRFWANEVLAQKNSVLSTIVDVLEGRSDIRINARDLKYFPARKAHD